jgi:Putative phage tail protein
MATINELKEQSVTETPLLLFDCELASGAIERWSTHRVDFEGHRYEARVLRHNLFDLQAGADEGIDALARISISLANADSHFSQIERNTGWKGSKVTVRFVFFDLRQGTAASEAEVLFRGIVDAPQEITETALRLSASNSMNLQRVSLPDVRVQKRCPWRFPATAAQRLEAVTGGAARYRYSPFYRCGYSADQDGGRGNLNAGAPYTICNRTRPDCEARGMFSEDSSARETRRFGGIEYVPASTLVRSYGDKAYHVSDPVENEARYNDFVPLIYGTAWHSPLIVFSKNDGNLTRMEVLLGMGEITSVLQVLVNNIVIPEGRPGTNMTATGWFSVVTPGSRSGGFNPNFADGSGNALGDPYGSMAMFAVVVPNRINSGSSLPRIQVLIQGMKLEQFAPDGSYMGESFTNNPAWVLLDVLQRCGWSLDDIDLGSFGRAAEYCAEPIAALDLFGNAIQIPRFQCNLVLRNRRSAGDVARGIRNNARLFLRYGAAGQLEMGMENTLALEQPTKPGGSNGEAALNGGWPSYEFGDGSNGFSGILRKSNGEPAIRVWSKSTAETANRVTLEFQDAFNEYQQDSLSLADADDVSAAGQEISLALPVLGIPNFNQAARVAKYYLDKAIAGNTNVEFETSVRGVRLKPGDLVTVTYLKEGFDRQPFRISKIAPGANYGTALITAQIHQDEWYTDDNTFENSPVRRQPGAGAGAPRPLVGKVLDAEGTPQFEIVEKSREGADGGTSLTLEAGFVVPAQPAMSGLGIPIVSLAAQSESSGGSLGGDQTLYYAVTATDASGAESGLSFVVRATIPPGTNTNRVTLGGLSFSANSTGFNVYRGPTPQQLFRIASNQAIAPTFTDAGAAIGLEPPPDANYDHADFYWRLELQPECVATTYSSDTIGNSTLGMGVNGYQGMVVRITKGTGAGQERAIESNDATTLTVRRKWDVVPDTTSYFAIAESGWHFGARGASSPVEFEIPARVGATLHVSGRAANAQGTECAWELSPLTRWRISGAGAALDAEAPGQPVFGLAPRGRGSVELMTIAFSELTNTRTISSATLTLNYWNELGSPSQVLLSGAVGETDTSIGLTQAGSAAVGGLVQIEWEIMRVEEVLNGGLEYRVTRGAEGSTAVAHAAQTPVYHLDSKVFVVAFPRDFFGSPASGNFSYPILLADARIACAQLYVTNAIGNSEPGPACYTGTVDGGLRTLSGGQFTIQVEGYLAIQTNAAPPLIAQETHSVRQIFAVVNEAPTVDAVELEIRRDDALYCSLTIAAGSRYSNVVDGFGLAPLAAGAQIGLNIVSVPGSADATPGRDLTVTIRM